MTPEELEQVFELAANNALLYGIGFIRIINTPSGMDIETIQPEEYLAMSRALEWASENMGKVRQQ